MIDGVQGVPSKFLNPAALRARQSSPRPFWAQSSHAPWLLTLVPAFNSCNVDIFSCAFFFASTPITSKSSRDGGRHGALTTSYWCLVSLPWSYRLSSLEGPFVDRSHSVGDWPLKGSCSNPGGSEIW